ncbi:MAG: hypothetical protein M5Z89_02040 [Olivibacter sp.]|nr:hypothetical protein [Olivibacter sp. UJ_SKK_5.1]
MTWITFTVYLIVGYLAYYTLNILFDLLKKPTVQAGSVETLTVSDSVETIEVEDDSDGDVVITANNSDIEEKIKSNHSENKSKKEVNNLIEEEPESQIIPSTVEAVISPNGGVPLKSLAELFRQKAIRESNQLPFAS